MLAHLCKLYQIDLFSKNLPIFIPQELGQISCEKSIKNKNFVFSGTGKSQTTECTQYLINSPSKQVQIVDTIGFADTENRNAASKIFEILNENPIEFNAMLWFLNKSEITRFTNESKEISNQIQQFLTKSNINSLFFCVTDVDYEDLQGKEMKDLILLNKELNGLSINKIFYLKFPFLPYFSKLLIEKKDKLKAQECWLESRKVLKELLELIQQTPGFRGNEINELLVKRKELDEIVEAIQLLFSQHLMWEVHKTLNEINFNKINSNKKSINFETQLKFEKITKTTSIKTNTLEYNCLVCKKTCVENCIGLEKIGCYITLGLYERIFSCDICHCLKKFHSYENMKYEDILEDNKNAKILLKQLEQLEQFKEVDMENIKKSFEQKSEELSQKIQEIDKNLEEKLHLLKNVLEYISIKAKNGEVEKKNFVNDIQTIIFQKIDEANFNILLGEDQEQEKKKIESVIILEKDSLSKKIKNSLNN